jgi:MFS family permease
MSGSFLFFLLGGIIGSHLTPTPALATLPVSVMIAGLAASVVPAGLLIHRFGRRAVFVGSALQAAGGCILAGYAISTQRFWLFCAAAFLLGSNNAVVMQYRFAATEYVEAGHASRAIAVVMCGALAAAWLGPELAVRTADLVPSARHAGSFYSATGLYLVAAVLLSRISAAAPAGAADLAPPRPLREIAAQPVFQVAVLGALASYTVMSFIMTATPISMHVHEHYSDMHTAWVIQSHVLAMYGPSLVTGRLIARIGVRAAMLAGLALMAACVIVDGSGQALAHYWGGLVLLGLGWNLLFVAGTTLLTSCYRAAERFRAQAVNDFSVFGAQAVASLLAGPAVHSLGWTQLNVAVAPLLLGLGLVLLLRSPTPVGAAGAAPFSGRGTR